MTHLRLVAPNILCHHCRAPMAVPGPQFCDGCEEFFRQLDLDAELDRGELEEFAAEAQEPWWDLTLAEIP